MSKREMVFNDLKVDNLFVATRDYLSRDKYDNIVTIKKGELLEILDILNEDNITIGNDDNCICVDMYRLNKYFKFRKVVNNENMQVVPKHDDVKLAFRNSNVIVVILDTGFKGVAHRNLEDCFDINVGYTIAYNRAKLKEANYSYKAEKAEANYIIKQAQKTLIDLDKKYKKREGVYRYNIGKAISEVETLPF